MFHFATQVHSSTRNLQNTNGKCLLNKTTSLFTCKVYFFTPNQISEMAFFLEQMCVLCPEALTVDSLEDKQEHTAAPQCCTSLSHTHHSWWCPVPVSEGPGTLGMCTAAGLCSSGTWGWTESCSCEKCAPLPGRRRCSRPHCSLDSHQPTSSPEQRAPTERRHRAEWLCGTGAVRGTEGTLSPLEEEQSHLKHATQHTLYSAGNTPLLPGNMSS